MKRFKLGLLPAIIIAIVLGIIIGSFSPKEVLRTLATFNEIFGKFLSFVVPLIILGFVTPGIGQLGQRAGKLLGMTTIVAYVSTILAGSLAFLTATSIFPSFLEVGSLAISGKNPEESLAKPFFNMELEPIIGIMPALLLSFTLGLGMATIKNSQLLKVTEEFGEIIGKLIKNVIIPLLPVHILGIFANMTYAGEVAIILSVFAKVFLIVIGLHILYLLLQYSVAGAFSKQNPFQLIKTMLPAYFTALGTQSSAATIPVTLAQTKKNEVKESIANFVVPLSATIHLSGSTITLVSCSLAVMMLHDMSISFLHLFPFILMLGVTMIAAPGIPGGAVMAAVGLLDSMLHFNGTLISLMIALYIAQDSFGTACNVTGDGAIAIVVDEINSKGKE